MTLAELKKEHGIGDDFISWLIFQQLVFETERVGVDGSLYKHNTLEHGLVRGVIGEAQEALEELEKIKQLKELNPEQTELLEELQNHLKLELIDVLVFLGSVFLHAGMNGAEVIELAANKLESNRKKYDKRNFESRTITEGIAYSRQLHRERTNTTSPRPGVSIPITNSSGPIFGESEEYSLSGAGSLT